GKGTGLGLSMVYATVKAHGGSVSLHSEPGRGTTVRILLPAAAAAPDGNGKVRAQAAGPGALRILQVDDDELILASVPLMLEQRGHRVETAAGGQEALERLRGGLQVDLVVLDLNMPGMNGLETLQRLRETHPGLPVLLATGYLDAATEAQIRQCGRALSIAKPFSLEDLDALARKLLAGG
ncbi:MAG TPA: response regulator, partial [bacterium]|nr:response regulator [bacterium]